MHRLIYILTFLLIISVPNTIFANHNSPRSVNRSSLDNEVVKRLPIPVLFGVAYTDINPDFNDPRGDGTRFHEGEDILAPQGAPIVSPTEAIVIRTGSGESSGNYVYTANPGGETFRYMHLDYIANLDSGDKLKPGDFIGTVGDTGNAPDGAYHLHLEVRDDKNEPQDPYPRLTGEFSLEDKVSFLEDILKDVKDDEEFAEFLVENYDSDLKTALNAGYELPQEIIESLKRVGIVSQKQRLDQLETLFRNLPKSNTAELSLGSNGSAVVLLQLYLIYMNEGLARDELQKAGPTGYYGPITVAALSEYQLTHKLNITGVYDKETRLEMVDDKEATLTLR